MSTETAGTSSAMTPAQHIAGGYSVDGPALELGTVVVDGAVAAMAVAYCGGGRRDLTLALARARRGPDLS